MSDTLFPAHIRALKPYEPGRSSSKIEHQFGVAVRARLGSNENPVGPSPKVASALEPVLKALHRYPDSDAAELKQRIAGQLGATAADIIVGHGSNEIIDHICRVTLTEGDHAVTFSPSFSCYRTGVRAAAAEITEVPLGAGFRMDVDALLTAVTQRTKLVWLSNPNNPTGTYVTKGELARLSAALPEHIVLVVDEAYIEFATAPDCASALALRSSRERLAVLRTFSKAYGLAGLRVGYAVAWPDLARYIDCVRPPFNVNALAQAAALAALADVDHLERTVKLIVGERDRVVSGLKALGLAVTPSQANFVMVDVGRSAAAVGEALLARGIIVRWFGPPLERSLRISIGLPDENSAMLTELSAVLTQVPRA